MNQSLDLPTALSVRGPAEKGEANAQFFLGLCYCHDDDGVSKDLTEAAKWFRKAADQGHKMVLEALKDLGK